MLTKLCLLIYISLHEKWPNVPHFRCNQIHTLYGALPGPLATVRDTHGALVAYRYTYGALPGPYETVRDTRGTLVAYRYTCAPPRHIRVFFLCAAGLLLPCQYLNGTILVTPYSMVWDWRVSRAGSMPLYWPCCILPLKNKYFNNNNNNSRAKIILTIFIILA